MIKLNHKNKIVENVVKELIEDVLENTNMENFDCEEHPHYLLVHGTHKGYMFTYTRDKETCEVTVRACWQLSHCPNPIFEA